LRLTQKLLPAKGKAGPFWVEMTNWSSCWKYALTERLPSAAINRA